MIRNTFKITAAIAVAAGGIAFAAERNTPRVDTVFSTLKAGGTVHAGQVVGATNGYGYARVSQLANTLTTVGVAVNSAVSNSTLMVRSGVFGLKNDGGVTSSHIGLKGYAYTNDTGFTVSSSGVVEYGIITDVDDDYVWVKVGF